MQTKLFSHLKKNSMKISKTEILPLSIGIIFLAFIGYHLSCSLIKAIHMNKNTGYTKAVIYKFSSGSRGNEYSYYKFLINGKEYYGSGLRFNNDVLLDTIVIVYDTTEPNNNNSYRDYEGSLFSYF
jgi:hypothetical protein